MTSLRQGIFAGLLAGFVQAALYFFDYGPGNDLAGIARWLGLHSTDTERLLGFLMLIILGGVFGLLFGLLQRGRVIALGRALLLGVATGVVYWIVLVVLFGMVINHIGIDFGGFLYSFVPLLLYGMLLGAFYYSGSVKRAEYI